MTVVVAVFGICIVALGVTGIWSPARIFDLVARWQSRSGLYALAGVRLLLGAALILAAPESRSPLYLQVFGGLACLAGLATPFFGVARFEALLRWWRERPPAFVRLMFVFVILLGSSFLWAVFPGGT